MLASLTIALLLAAPTAPPEPAWRRLQDLVGTRESTPAKINLAFRLQVRRQNTLVMSETYLADGKAEVTKTTFQRQPAAAP